MEEIVKTDYWRGLKLKPPEHQKRLAAGQGKGQGMEVAKRNGKGNERRRKRGRKIGDGKTRGMLSPQMCNPGVATGLTHNPSAAVGPLSDCHLDSIRDK